MQNLAETSGYCGCSPMTPASYSQPEVARAEKTDGKFYHEIATEMIGNALIIRVEKEKNRNRKFRGSWDPPCDCDIVEIRRPKTRGENPKIVNGGENNQILFKVYSNSRIPKDDNFKPQTIAYKVGACRGTDNDNQCRTITVHPQLGGPGSQEVHSDHVTEGNQDIFLLRIKKKGDTIDPKERNIELELTTPKPPTPPPPPPELPTVTQVNHQSILPEKKKAKGKGKGKGKGKK